MASAKEYATLPSVTAAAQFSVDTGETPVALVSEQGRGQDKRSGSYEERTIAIRDGRAIANRLDIDREGFALLDEPTAMADFFDDDEVRRVYYPEMDALVKRLTGCAKVVVFDHTIRVDDPAVQSGRKVRGPARNMHNDFTIRSAEQRVRDLLPPEEAEARLKNRYGSINIWRPIVGPVETAPLAICEWGAIAEKDLFTAERYYKNRIGGVYHLIYNPDQRWYYFPNMERGEIVVLKCFDTLTDGTARWTAHGAFDDPTSPPDAPPRQSIEIRTLYFFD